MNRIWMIDAPHFCCAVIERRGDIVNAAPIVKYMIGWDVSRVISYCRSKRWECYCYDRR